MVSSVFEGCKNLPGFGMESTLTFSGLQKQYGTGRAYTISGTGRNRVTGYRTGVKCALGDIEESEWAQMVRDLVERSGEQELHQQLLMYVKENCPWCRSKKELERKALELHAARIFENRAWVGFMEFERKYRTRALVTGIDSMGSLNGSSGVAK